jgi:dephospho-CoA kinase
MKIYISSSHSCGKSTLARYISKTYNLPLISEVARMVLSEKELNFSTLRSNIDIVDDYQNNIFNRQILEEQKYKDFVSDRSLLDCLAYSASHSRIVSKLIFSDELKSYIENIKSSIIFFIRPSKDTLNEDGVREQLDWDGIVSIDAQIKFILEMYNLRYFQINTSNMSERIKFVDSIISIIK